MSDYPCAVCANTMLPGMTYTFPRQPETRSSGMLYDYHTTSAGMLNPPPPTLIDCYTCKGTGLVTDRRSGRQRRSAWFGDRRAESFGVAMRANQNEPH